MADKSPVTGSFTATGASANKAIYKRGVFRIAGFGSASVQLEQSVDRVNWFVVPKPDGTNSYTADTTQMFIAPEMDVYYRLNCTAYSSGTITYRLAQGDWTEN